MDELGIFWASEDGHIEVPGAYFYGYWEREIPPDIASSLAEPWQGIESDIALQRIEADEGNFLIMPVRIKFWPTDHLWRSAVEATLGKMVAAGARVAWCGGENCSWSLTELAPDTTSGHVYSAHSTMSGLIINSGIYEEIEYLSDEQLVSLCI